MLCARQKISHFRNQRLSALVLEVTTPFFDLLLHKEEISAECVRGLRDASFQYRTCWYVKLMCAMSSLSDRFHNQEASFAMEFVSPKMLVSVEINQ